ncbi:MAG: hypothetical protein GX052_00110 [Syntrophomonadaceae bacterium]|jgi:hypothetical protein|nr:hypothetical protein [Syntrophomonadaceae bacterium]
MEPLLPHGQANVILTGGFLITAPKNLPHFEQVILYTWLSSFLKLAYIIERSFNEKIWETAIDCALGKLGRQKTTGNKKAR